MTALYNRLETIDTAGVQALGMHGEAVWRSFTQIRDVVGSRIGPEAAALFAAPALHENGGKIDWYATAPGDPVPWHSADLAQRETIVSRIETLRPAIEGLSDNLLNSGSDAAISMGSLIAHALHLSNEKHIYLVGEHDTLGV